MRLLVIAALLSSACGPGVQRPNVLCEAVTCHDPPPDECLAPDTLRSYSAQGVCDPVRGTCSYTPVDSVCGRGCHDGQRCRQNGDVLWTARELLEEPLNAPRVAAIGAEGTVYLISGRTVFALGGAGQIRWRVVLEGTEAGITKIGHLVVADDDTVFFTHHVVDSTIDTIARPTGEPTLIHAVSADGELLWQRSPPSDTRSLDIAGLAVGRDRTLYAVAREGEAWGRDNAVVLHALDDATGGGRWRRPIPADLSPPPAITPVAFFASTPVIDRQGLVYVVVAGSGVHALSEEQHHWSNPLNVNTEADLALGQGSPGGADDLLLVWGNRLTDSANLPTAVALSRTDGSQQFDLAHRAGLFDEQGQLIWVTETGDVPGLSITGPTGEGRTIATPGLQPTWAVLAQQDVLYVNARRPTEGDETESVVAALRRDGTLVWAAPGAFGTPLLGPGPTLYYTSGGGRGDVTAVVCDQPLATSAWPQRQGTAQNNGRTNIATTPP